jgi:hypothetical protein
MNSLPEAGYTPHKVSGTHYPNFGRVAFARIAPYIGPQQGADMAEPTIKELQGERNRLWAEARLKGLPVGSAQRDRIAALDVIIRERKAATAIPSKRPKKQPPPDTAK